MPEILPAGNGMELFAGEGMSVRVLRLDGDPWFVAVDVCRALEVGNPRQACSYLDDDEVRAVPVTTDDGSSRTLSTNVVSEAGLYSLILRSRKDGAKRFKRWVTHEVLPTIRRTGSYETAPAPREELDELEVAERYVAALKRNRELEAANAAAETKVAELEPAASAWTTLYDAYGDYDVADAAKVLSRDPAVKIGRDRLFTVLRELRWCYRGSDGRHRIYQTAIETGRLSERGSSHYHPRTGELIWDPPQVRVTVKGLEALLSHLNGAQPLAIEPAPSSPQLRLT